MRKFAPIAMALCVLLVFPATAAPKKKTTKKPPPEAVTCPTTLADCPDQGCAPSGDFDPNLNTLKNMHPDDPKTQGVAESRTLQSIKDLADPEDFKKGGPRDELTALGEGTKVSVVGYVLIIRRESGESCNCKLTDDGLKNKDVAVNTDNHLVVVSRATVDQFPLSSGAAKDVLKQREAESLTAEFTPRVRLAHPNFTRAMIQPLIDNAPEEALRVRLTGMLMFDSEHFIQHHLLRVNNWEVHPILKLEVCPDDTCQPNSDAGWKSLDDMTP
jgi:hypothetical protein